MTREAPPTFYLKGNAVFDWLEVFDLGSSATSTGEPRPIWRIQPTVAAPELNAVPPIVYGKVPNGFAQDNPNDEPPPLQEGHHYRLRVIIRTPNEIQLDEVFVIHNGKVYVIEGREQYQSTCGGD